MLQDGCPCKTCIITSDRYKFDDIFQKYYGTDSNLEIHATLDFLGEKISSLILF